MSLIVHRALPGGGASHHEDGHPRSMSLSPHRHQHTIGIAKVDILRKMTMLNAAYTYTTVARPAPGFETVCSCMQPMAAPASSMSTALAALANAYYGAGCDRGCLEGAAGPAGRGFQPRACCARPAAGI